MKYLTTFEIELSVLFILIALFVLFAKINEKYIGTLFVRAGIVIIVFSTFIVCDIVLNVINLLTIK